MRKVICFLGNILFYFKIRRNIAPKKILIIRSGGIGDVLMSTPLVKAVRSHYKNAKITYFVGNWSKDVLKDNPSIDSIFHYDDLTIIRMRILGIIKIIWQMRKEKFDLCLNLEKSWHWAVLSFLFGIPVRVGFDRFGEGFAHTIAAPFDGSKYELEYYLDLAGLLNIKIPAYDMGVYLTKKEKETANKIMKKYHLENKTVLGISPGGADNPAQQAFIKRWPIGNYIELIDRLAEKDKKIRIVLFGGEKDVEACDEIIKKAKNRDRVINTAGRFTIKESAALMKKCRLFLAHDSGPMHLAAAAKVKLLVLFGPTQPERFAPRNAEIIRSKTGCSPCYNIYGLFNKCRENKCMESIKAEDVANKLRKMISHPKKL